MTSISLAAAVFGIIFITGARIFVIIIIAYACNGAFARAARCALRIVDAVGVANNAFCAAVIIIAQNACAIFKVIGLTARLKRACAADAFADSPSFDLRAIDKIRPARRFAVDFAAVVCCVAVITAVANEFASPFGRSAFGFLADACICGVFGCASRIEAAASIGIALVTLPVFHEIIVFAIVCYAFAVDAFCR